MALGGYLRKIAWIDLKKGSVHEQKVDKSIYEKFLGGYGLGAYFLLKSMRPLIEPLGEDNILGFVTGPLTGTPAPTGSRLTVVCKSPLTNTWGDSNAGGFFGPNLKFSGYDGLFVSGISPTPIYILIDNNKIEIRDAINYWGKTTYQTENELRKKFGTKAHVVCIGQAGERLSLISSIITYHGRAAARSGVGAVMGSKKIKAVVVRGDQKVHLDNPEEVKKLKKKYFKFLLKEEGRAAHYKNTGTPGYIVPSILLGDSPTKNWSGIGPSDFKNFESLSFDKLINYREKKDACWRCPIACWGTVKFKYKGQNIKCHQPEYETASAFGSNCLNNDLQSIILSNDLCNKYGLDTISTGATIAFAMECFEKGIINKSDTDGVDLTWGNSDAIIKMIEKIAFRDGFGDILADGVYRASKQIGKESEDLAIHVNGQELAMHDPRYEPALGLIYKIDATPGRHSQASQFYPPIDMKMNTPAFGETRKFQIEKVKDVKKLICLGHIMNSSGICLFGYLSFNQNFLSEFLTAVTGHPYDLSTLLIMGERICNIRHIFNLREKINPAKLSVPKRAFGIPPLHNGPTKGITVDIDAMTEEYYYAMGWNFETGQPNKNKIIDLGLSDLFQDSF